MEKKLYNVFSQSKVTREKKEKKRQQNNQTKKKKKKKAGSKLCRERENNFKGLLTFSERQDSLPTKQEQDGMRKEHSEYTKS